MKFGVREICNVVFKAAANQQKIGSKTFDAGEPVIYFDSLKTSTLEQTVTTVYAQGGRGNTRLIGWDGEKTLTFTMEDALISEMGLAILAGANLYEATGEETMLVHVTEIVSNGTLSGTPTTAEGVKAYYFTLDSNGEIDGDATEYTSETTLDANTTYLVDYYIEKANGARQIDIAPEAFGGNFYIEADTLFRDTVGKDHAAQFIIPNGKIQSNFTLTMASSGDPSTFTFTVDAFPGYVNGDFSKKVMSAIQILDDTDVIEVAGMAGDKADSSAQRFEGAETTQG